MTDLSILLSPFLIGSFSSLAHKAVSLISVVDDVSVQVDGSLDRWIDKKPEERSITLLVTVGHFEMPGPEEVRRLE